MHSVLLDMNWIYTDSPQKYFIIQDYIKSVLVNKYSVIHFERKYSWNKMKYNIVLNTPLICSLKRIIEVSRFFINTKALWSDHAVDVTFGRLLELTPQDIINQS